MNNEYTPDYAKGEILVCFLNKIDANKGFAKTLAKSLGYELKDEDYEVGGSYIIQTLPGKEEKACADFKKEKRFVDWAERRDLKLEKRFHDLDTLVALAEEVRDNASDCNLDYNKRLGSLIDYARSLKEPVQKK
ncbi:MAG: hypothetical protein KKF46_05190 [Nanoarchaeota archaeon]|nr:hypothetical protein [Nanoarchaeota archaeon]MBU1321728.1 hypothetical protein [Nanoarchaeota archaeon]MBU1597694.1 hypothetical protein [Nanoarchaeota archaeon]MBU2440744.1 hypothetical protein [Nanoarchaeota archaeon]